MCTTKTIFFMFLFGALLVFGCNSSVNISNGDETYCMNDSDCESGEKCDAGTCIDADGDFDLSDGDEDLADVETVEQESELDLECSNFSGLYRAEFSCGENTETYDSWVVVDYESCQFSLVYREGDNILGYVDSEQIVTNEGKTCSGSYTEGVVNTIDLSCEDGCNLKLTLTSSDTRAVIEASPSSVDFGHVEYMTARQDLSLENIGYDDLKIYSVFLEDDSDEFSIQDLVLGWENPEVIEPGESFDVFIDLTINEAANIENTLIVISNAVNAPVLRVKIQTTTCGKPRIIADPELLDFGSSPPDYDNVRYFLAKNRGGVTASITDIKITESADGAFSLLLSSEATPPFEIYSGYSQAIEVNFRPIDGVHTAPSTLTGKLCVSWLDYDNGVEDTCVDLIGSVQEMQPPCIAINPLEGVSGIWGLEDLDGPGVKFGYQQSETHTKRDVEITNCGDLPLELSDFAWNEIYTTPPMSARAFMEEVGDFQNRSLNRGETAIVTIDFYPIKANEGILQTAAFQFNTNAEWYDWLDGPPDPELNGVVVVGVSGTSAVRGVNVLPSKVDFGLISPNCCSRAEELTVYNTGELPLEIAEITIGAGSDNGFELLQVEAPVSIGPDTVQSTRFKVRFCPDRSGDFDGHVLIKSNDSGTAEFVVPLVGEGTGMDHQRDEFSQYQSKKIDMLWVIDCSGSMGDEYSNLSNTYDTFIRQAVSGEYDMHIAITSCDIINPTHSGNFLGLPKVLDLFRLTDQDAIDIFHSNALGLGNICANQVNCVEAAMLAVNEPLASGGNSGFLRDDATLSVQLVSDQQINCDNYTDQQAKDICEGSGSYMDVMENSTASLASQFFLSRLADSSTIVVKINNTVNNDWDYDETSNSIIFQADNPPPSGASIVVEYDILCLH